MAKFNNGLVPLMAMAIAMAHTLLATAAESNGLIADSHLDVLARNFYFNRDLRNGLSNNLGRNAFKSADERNGYREEWAQGFITNFVSGFTLGLVGVGVDGHLLAAFKLDSGGGRAGLNLLNVNSEGHPSDSYAEVGGSVKVRASKSVLRYGSQMPATPVFAVSTVRLLPATATGWSLNVNELDNLNIDAGRFTSISGVDSTNSDDDLTTDYAVGIHSKRIDYLGLNYKEGDFSASIYGSELLDVWRQYYFGGKYKVTVSPGRSVSFNFNSYRTTSYGAENGGEINNFAWSLMSGYSQAGHTLSVGYQALYGDEPLDWVGFGTMGGNVLMGNAVQYATFTEANEKSWQIRYDLDLAAYGVPGLAFMTRYVRGDEMDNNGSTNSRYTARHIYDDDKDNKHWERDIEIKYVIQSGPAKDLSLRLRQATHRATTGYRYLDVDEYRFIVEMPFNVF
ncbi:MAG: OprD family porin [Candidatus Pseudomonas phytovorans]|uniref:OprD family porin n=1 Tax=Candidatus Pseudomonas phytovorans TaxID=3121377 RepID=A0AAJ6B8M0_9PSED|nr:OprD family porin [Pseudomonas sp.]WEK28505.1 MAG: OprD family porin [Pseudomonas sp.]